MLIVVNKKEVEMKFRIHSLIIVLVYVLLLVGGVYLYHQVEGWGYLDSAYFLVITATTIGYGDLTPQTDLGKIITMVYSFIGIVFVFYLISIITHKVFESKLEERIGDIREKKKRIVELKKKVQKV